MPKDLMNHLLTVIEETGILFVDITPTGEIIDGYGDGLSNCHHMYEFIDQRSKERLQSIIASDETSGVSDVYVKTNDTASPYLLHYIQDQNLSLLLVPYPDSYMKSISSLMDTNRKLSQLFEEKAQLEHQLQSQMEELRMNSITDSLTGLYNREYLYEYIFEVIDEAQWERLTFIMIDFNQFKLVNDSYGHKQGDQLLRNFAEIITPYFTHTFRFGGDEFVIVTMDLNENDYDKYFEQINEEFQKCSRIASLSYGKTSISKQEAQHIESEEDIDRIITRADKKMYENKRKR
ncbi:diguanylate cyclase [Gracilibacillus halophilus YIM-C55.5]|uniref:Diguanylate cyclase n=1 Tax=Gracilibacillus halophilus YIM-C55.5 TaxID=1308866 RepID=N4WEC7_9BACI|nr:GGDEF domain-containing protein [Gracilibacillus halophilus]ENH97574.1 diguanylate cyclase [Gracilibacillus halophilus YIM-C55.5]